MTRVAWTFNGYSWPINPSKATIWLDDPSYIEDLPIKASTSRLQYVGKKAGRRTVSGTIIGPSAVTFYNNIVSWRDGRVISALTDHFGNSRLCRVWSFQGEEVFDLRSWMANPPRPMYTYTIEFIAV